MTKPPYNLIYNTALATNNPAVSLHILIAVKPNERKQRRSIFFLLAHGVSDCLVLLRLYSFAWYLPIFTNTRITTPAVILKIRTLAILSNYRTIRDLDRKEAFTRSAFEHALHMTACLPNPHTFLERLFDKYSNCIKFYQTVKFLQILFILRHTIVTCLDYCS